MSSKKTIIHEFDPCIYPRLLWVFKCVDKVRKYKEVKNGCDKGESEDRQEGEPQEACEEKKEDNSTKQ